MRQKRMAAISLDPTLSLQRIGKDSPHRHRAVIEEIEGLIRVYDDGHVERPQVVPCVTSTLSLELGVTSRDMVIDKFTNIWARFYVPAAASSSHGNLPLLVYFHGGGFCIGSAAWSCYHEFLARLSAKAGCLIMSVNYRLAPENPLPAAYEDGLTALIWLKQQSLRGSSSDQYWWSSLCNFSKIFLAGDSAGANIAHNVATRLCSNNAMSLKPLSLKGTILIQPFFGGEARTHSENYMVQPPRSALSLAASDAYWRLALPAGANRDHPWCNPSCKELKAVKHLPAMVCISEMDILKDRNMELCRALGKSSEYVVYKGVGHAFQVLSRTQLSQIRTLEMVADIKAFITR
ncbi:probable carboxylesterase 6 [Corylus avellana]|uniref:probable carboxylesterase 6 n=1 Tax=Corylus avellana TaxID=13451 RepID=UPI00286A7A82|nr:probable carboxylesterase 6 [Corylus avellana]